MRIGSSVLLVDGYCYQSYGWKKLRPLGSLQNIINSLEAYQCDEISIIRPVRENDSIKAFKKDLVIIQKLNCMTPISFGGGIKNSEMVDLLHNLPVERLIFSSAFITENYKPIEHAIELYGHQAIQCAIPLGILNGELKVFHSNSNVYTSIDAIDFNMIEKLSNEIILIDIDNEGCNDKFNKRMLDFIDIDYNRLVISGGIGKAAIKFAYNNNIASVMIDNRVLHNEYSIKGYKNYGRV